MQKPIEALKTIVLWANIFILVALIMAAGLAVGHLLAELMTYLFV